MDSTGEQKTQLEQRMEDRMRELGIDWADLSRRAGNMSRQNLLDIRRGIKNPRTKTRSRIESALELAAGGFEQMERGEKPTPSAPPPPVEQLFDLTTVFADLAALDEVLKADIDELRTMSRMVARFLAKREGRALSEADQKRFMLWALQMQADQGRGIEPPGDD